MKPNWVNFDETSDVLASLKLFRECLEGMASEPHKLKWAILSLHSATTGAMVCELSGSANVGALSEKAAKKTLDYFDKKIPAGMPRQHLASPRILIQRIVDPSKRLERTSAAIELSPEWVEHFIWLTEFRDSFTHFSPKSWSIDPEGIPMVFLSCLSIIRAIRNADWAFRHLEQPVLERLDQQLEDVFVICSRLE